MKINSIYASAFKGHSFKHEFDPMTVFVGPNFAGKTARLDALQIAMAGFHPMVERNNSGLFRFASGLKMEVRALLDDGSQIMRSFEMKKGVVKADSVRMNNFQDAPAVLIDANAYFTLSDRERMKMVFNLLANVGLPDEMSAKAIAAKVKAITPKESTEAAVEVITELFDEVIDTDEARVRDNETVQDWINSLAESWRKRKSEADAAVKRMTGTVQGITELKNQTPIESIPDSIDADVLALRTQIGIVENEMASIDREMHINARRTARKVEIETLLANRTDTEKKVADLSVKVEQFRKDALEYSSHVPRLTAKVQVSERDLVRLQKEVAQANNDLYESEAGMRELNRLEACPTCGNESGNWKQKLTDQQQELIDKHKFAINSLHKRIEAERKSLDEHRVQLGQATELDDANRNKQVQLKALEDQLRSATAIQQSFNVIAGELEGLGTSADLVALQEQRNKLNTDRGTKRTKLSELEEKQRRAIQIRTENASRIRADAERKKVLAESDVTKQALELIETVQGKMVEQAFTTILALANQIAVPVLKSELSYSEGEIGMKRGHSWVPHKTFSGTEKAIAYAAISLALAVQSQVKLLMIDELGRLDKDSKTALLNCIDKLIRAGMIDQFIGVDITGSAAPYKKQKVKVIEIDFAPTTS